MSALGRMYKLVIRLQYADNMASSHVDGTPQVYHRLIVRALLGMTCAVSKRLTQGGRRVEYLPV